ncbi:ABC transporter ATP-binding protein [Chlorobaculum tepidum]|uniref:ABC transporter ATP-binding protein n=1 Tax=Chlorobaculum tepidum TaxID=1097 RepID=UPI0013E8DE4C|nr:ABC transporter ATP-binding protein [Chlorobaculum tepidum]
MKILLRILRYLAPSKGKIALVIVVSMLTSLFSVVSIYSILPLLNEVFSTNQTALKAEPATTTHPTLALQKTRPPQPDQRLSTTDATGKNPGDKTLKSKAIQLKTWALEKFQAMFNAPTKEETLLKICLFLISAFALKNLFIYLNKQIIFRIQTKTAKKLRDDVFSSIIEMQLDYFNKNRVGNLMNYVYNDVENVNNSISATFVNFLQNPFSIIVFLAVLLTLSWQLTLFSAVTSIFILVFVRMIGKKIRGLARRYQVNMGNMNSVLQEKFNGIKIIKSTAFEEVEFNKFKAFTKEFRTLGIRISQLKNMIGPLNETLMIAAIAMVLWFGGLQVFNGMMTANELLLFAFTLYSTMGPIKQLGDANTAIEAGLVSVERLFEVLDAEPEIVNGNRSISTFNEAIRFEDVCFKYNKEDPNAPNILDHVSFEIKKGEMVALVGQSGSGKSTAVDLLMRFYDVDSGRITIDNIDIREFDYKQLRKMIGVVSQEVILFNDTIEQNIAYGVHEEIEHDQIEKAAKLANAHQFIMEKPEQYDTMIGDRGIQLSGGQRQRIAIARAMVKNPELLIFDEATSALDNESEKVVQDAIDHAMENRTALVVAHRLSTIKNADKIIVMERGKVVEAGNHAALLEKNGVYKMLYDIQFTGQAANRQQTT